MAHVPVCCCNREVGFCSAAKKGKCTAQCSPQKSSQLWGVCGILLLDGLYPLLGKLVHDDMHVSLQFSLALLQ